MAGSVSRWTRGSYLTVTSLLAALAVGGCLAWANLRWTTESRPPSRYVGGALLNDGEYMNTGFFDPETAPTHICDEQGWPLAFRSVVLGSEFRDGTTYRLPPDMIGHLRLFTKPSALVAIVVDSVVGMALMVFAALAVWFVVRRVLLRSEPHNPGVEADQAV